MALNRREFLKISAGSGILLASDLSPSLASEPKSLPPEAVGILYDATLCIGCKSCMVNCKKYNSMPKGALEQEYGEIPYEYQSDLQIYDAPIDLSAKTLNIIKTYTNGTGLNKDQEIDGFSFVKQHCLHCVDPACVSVCPVAALFKNPVNGIVGYDKDKCIGCRYCQVACPFQIPKFEFESANPKIVKCQLCRHRYAEGKYAACCEFCPTGASIFGKVTELKAEAANRLAAQPGTEYAYPVKTVDSAEKSVRKVSGYVDHVYGLTEAGGTQYMLMSGVPFANLGFNPAINDQAYPDITWSYIKKVPVLIVALLTAGTVIHLKTKNRKEKSTKGESGQE
ncbi:MAG: hydrogenase 2 operon protein HybA [Proteobacteria bacterium]|nr:hydrogenase 2 operon protein HybA [Pseudomonadota bacterium]MBU1688740.1 hydrogenase 2 operon protein HybA [Pseudomonadota bacterium]